MRTNIIKRLFSVKSAFLLLIVGVTSQLTSCFHSNESAVAFAIQLSYTFDVPIYVALKDGDGEWVEVKVDATGNKINITDSKGEYTILVYGNYRGEKRGYQIESSVSDASHYNLKFDNTSATVNYTINGTVDNISSGVTYLGTDYRSFNNRITYTSPSFPSFGTATFQATFTQDADEPSSGDILTVGDHGGGHGNLQTLDYNSLSSYMYTADPGDYRTPATVDQTGAQANSNYLGTSVKFSGVNLKALFVEDDNSSPTVTYDKFPNLAGKTYSISGKWGFSSATFSADYKYSQYYNNPPDNLTINDSPASPPDMSVAEDNNYSIRFDYSGEWSSGISGLTNQVRGARIQASGTTLTTWYLTQTKSRYQVGAQTFGFDAAVLNEPGLPSDLVAPTPTASSIKASIYETNRTTQQEIDYQQSSHAASASDDLMIRGRMNISF